MYSSIDCIAKQTFMLVWRSRPFSTRARAVQSKGRLHQTTFMHGYFTVVLDCGNDFAAIYRYCCCSDK